MGRRGKPRELRWIELADQALAEEEQDTTEPSEEPPKAA